MQFFLTFEEARTLRTILDYVERGLENRLGIESNEWVRLALNLSRADVAHLKKKLFPNHSSTKES